MKTFSYIDRNENIRKMQERTFDLVIIGGGITGAGVARDAVSRGLTVALIESRDFAFGTSSRSSKLIHGGIRYLENFEFGLVFEALSERRTLFEIAPHLVHPLRFILPVYAGGRVGMFKLGLGMWAYDALSMFEAPELHERLNQSTVTQRLPMLNRNGLEGAYAYSDAYMDDERLVIETLRSASEEGAVCANYVAAKGVEMDQGKVTALQCEDMRTLKKFTIQGRHFISTVGPWTDQLGNAMFAPWKNILRPSKGIHLTLPKRRLGLHDAVVMADDAEKRIVFCIPRYEMIIIGTTDTDYKGDPAEVVTEREDVEYLIKVAGEYFPHARLNASDFQASYAGVRPLVNDGSATEGKTSREHVIIQDPRNVTFVAGGKYTTYRLMAEQTVHSALKQFGLEDRVRYARNNTKVPLNPQASQDMMERAHTMLDIWEHEVPLSRRQLQTLVERHGMETGDILQNFSWEDLAALPDDQKVWGLEALHAMTNTMCLNLDDFFLRRTHLFLANWDHGQSLIEPISKLFADKLGWNDPQRREQVARLQKHMDRELGWKKYFASSATGT